MDTLGADLSPCVLVQPDGWARGEREGYGEPCDVTSLSLGPSDTKSETTQKGALHSRRRQHGNGNRHRRRHERADGDAPLDLIHQVPPFEFARLLPKGFRGAM